MRLLINLRNNTKQTIYILYKISFYNKNIDMSFYNTIQSPFIKWMGESCPVSLIHGFFNLSLQPTLKTKSIFSYCPMLLSKYTTKCVST